MNLEEVSPIGRFVVIEHKGKCYTATVMDCVAGTLRPKRVRIQRDPEMQGRVLMPTEYTLKEYQAAPDDD